MIVGLFTCILRADWPPAQCGKWPTMDLIVLFVYMAFELRPNRCIWSQTFRMALNSDIKAHNSLEIHLS